MYRPRRRGDISITTIVMAAIALIVLVVIIAIFTGKTKIFSNNYDTASHSAISQVCSQKGYCVNDGNACATGSLEDGSKYIDCPDLGFCCVTH